MLKFTKGLFIVVGLAAAVIAVTFLVPLSSQVDQLVATARSSGGAPVSDPLPQIRIALIAAALTGLFIGAGMALPRRTTRSIRNETRAQIAASTPTSPPAPDQEEE